MTGRCAVIRSEIGFGSSVIGAPGASRAGVPPPMVIVIPPEVVVVGGGDLPGRLQTAEDLLFRRLRQITGVVIHERICRAAELSVKTVAQ
jgi:hypothetical protein